MSKVTLNRTIRAILNNALGQLFPDSFTLQVWYKEAGVLAYDVTIQVTVKEQPVFKRVYHVNLAEVLEFDGLGNNILGDVKTHFGKEGEEVKEAAPKKRVKNGW